MRRSACAFLCSCCALRACVRGVCAFWLLPHKSGRGGLVQRRRAPVQQLAAAMSRPSPALRDNAGYLCCYDTTATALCYWISS